MCATEIAWTAYVRAFVPARVFESVCVCVCLSVYMCCQVVSPGIQSKSIEDNFTAAHFQAFVFPAATTSDSRAPAATNFLPRSLSSCCLLLSACVCVCVCVCVCSCVCACTCKRVCGYVCAHISSLISHPLTCSLSGRK